MISACGKTETSISENTAKPVNAMTVNSLSEPKLSEVKPPTFSPNSPADTAEAVKFPFEDFPKVETTAKPGEYVLAPSYNWIKDAAEKGADSTNFIWYVRAEFRSGDGFKS